MHYAEVYGQLSNSRSEIIEILTCLEPDQSYIFTDIYRTIVEYLESPPKWLRNMKIERRGFLSSINRPHTTQDGTLDGWIRFPLKVRPMYSEKYELWYLMGEDFSPDYKHMLMNEVDGWPLGSDPDFSLVDIHPMSAVNTPSDILVSICQ